MLTLGDLASRVGAAIPDDDRDRVVDAMALPAVATAQDVTFLVPRIASLHTISQSSAAAVVAAGPLPGLATLVVPDVVIALARLAYWLPIRRAGCGLKAADRGAIDASACIAAGAKIAADVSVGEQTVIETGVVIGPGVHIGAFCSIGAGSVIEGASQIGNRVIVGAGCALGHAGFAFVRDGTGWVRVPCFGSVIIGDDAILLPQVVIHAGVFGDTSIGQRCALDSQVLIGHDSRVGDATMIAGQTAVAGSARIGRGCRIGGKVGIGEGVSIADGITVTAMSMVSRSLERPGASYSSGWPAEQSQRWWRRVGVWRRAGNRDEPADAPTARGDPRVD